jgi:hypothetical protein
LNDNTSFFILKSSIDKKKNWLRLH